MFIEDCFQTVTVALLLTVVTLLTTIINKDYDGYDVS